MSLFFDAPFSAISVIMPSTNSLLGSASFFTSAFGASVFTSEADSAFTASAFGASGFTSGVVALQVPPFQLQPLELF